MAGPQQASAGTAASTPRSWLGRLLTPVPPAVPRPSEVAYLHACNLVDYEKGDPSLVPGKTRDTLEHWRAWQAYDAAMAALHLPNPHAVVADGPGVPDQATAGLAEADTDRTQTDDATWRLLVEDLLPYLYARWDPITVAQAGRPRRGTPHLANRDATHLSTHLALWAQQHGRDYRWARRLLEQARAAGLIRKETHRSAYAGGHKMKEWSQWIPLPRDEYERRFAVLKADQESVAPPSPGGRAARATADSYAVCSRPSGVSTTTGRSSPRPIVDAAGRKSAAHTAPTCSPCRPRTPR